MYAALILAGLLNFILFIVLPIALIVFLVKHFSQKNKDAKGNKTTRAGLRELLLVCLMLGAATTGIAGVVMLPHAIFGVDDIAQSSAALIIYITASMVFLILGALFKQLTGKFLMIIGIMLLLFSVVPFVSNIGKSAGFIAVLLAFIVLVVLVIKAGRGEQHG